MASIFNSWTLIFYLFLLLIMSPFVTPLFFNLSSIGPGDANQIELQGDANISLHGLQVTADESSNAMSNGTGRATFIDPLHLWDSSSGKLTDFDTHFSFVINAAPDPSCYAKGLAFFLAPVDSTIPPSSWGGGLGLADPTDATADASIYPFVAVEFDTYTEENTWDPTGPHVGIDINSVTSVVTVPWLNGMFEGAANEAWIRYDSSSENLSVIVISSTNFTTETLNLEYSVDLRLYLPEWVSVGFSAETGYCFQTNNVNSWDFNSTELKIDSPVRNRTTPGTTDPDFGPTRSPAEKKLKAGKLIGLAAGLSVSVLGLILLGYCLWRKKSREGKEDESSMDIIMQNEFEKGSGPKKFSYGELVRATDDFAEEYKLGEGGFGGVYRGFLEDLNSYVAVKRLSKSSEQGAKEYASEVTIISRLRHRNLVQLIGWCHEKRELLLVYEFLPNGSLDSHLFNGRFSLTWETRYKVAQGLASALLYLHEEWEQCVIHRDIKSSNIMLDSSFNAKLGDFGLARLVDHEKESQTTVLAGTMGYMAPEYVISGKASKESDVYSFGIVALEIACGRKPIQVRAQGNQVRLVELVWELYGRGQHHEAADPKLCRDFNEQEMERLMVVGLWCAHPDSSYRPSIRQAIQVLSFEAQLPLLPSEMPVPTYSAAPPNTRTALPSQSNGTDTSNSGQPLSSSHAYNSVSSTSNFSSYSAASSSPSASLLYPR